jgi:hypothetical protein
VIKSIITGKHILRPKILPSQKMTNHAIDQGWPQISPLISPRPPYSAKIHKRAPKKYQLPQNKYKQLLSRNPIPRMTDIASSGEIFDENMKLGENKMPSGKTLELEDIICWLQIISQTKTNIFKRYSVSLEEINQGKDAITLIPWGNNSGVIIIN